MLWYILREVENAYIEYHIVSLNVPFIDLASRYFGFDYPHPVF